MTFDQYFDAIALLVFPEGEADNLVDRHRAWVQDAMVDLQRHVSCLQELNCDSTRQNESKIRCGTSILPAVVGEVQRVESYLADSACAIRSFQQIDSRHMDSVARNYTQCFSTSSSPARTGRLEDLPPCDIQDSPVATEDDVPTDRARGGFWSMDEQAIRLYPLLVVDEWAFVFWKGIRKQYNPDTVIAELFEGRDVMRAIENYLEAQVYRFQKNDIQSYRTAWAEYVEARRQLIIDCKRRTMVRIDDFGAAYLVASGGCGCSCAGAGIPGPTGDSIDYMEFDTVELMLASDTSRWRTARCTNFTAGDQYVSVWLRSDSQDVLPNGTDVLQAVDGAIVLRTYIREGPGDTVVIPNPNLSSPYTVANPISTPTIADLRASQYSVMLIIVVQDENGNLAHFRRSDEAGDDDGQNVVVNQAGITYRRAF